MLTSSGEIVRGLRRDLATAICEAQEASAPRSNVARMCYALLMHAFTVLDCESDVTAPDTIKIAVHALLEWRRCQHSNSLIARQPPSA